MDTALLTREEETVKQNNGLVAGLGVVLVLCVALLIGVVLLCVPYFGAQEELSLPTKETEETTLPPETEPVENWPSDLVPANPYGRNDFQYNEDNHLYCLAGESRIGIDVSAWQEEIDWMQVAASGIEFVIIRVGYRGYGAEGKLVQDAYAVDNIEGALAVGLDVGVYIYSQAITEEEAVEEAEFLLNIIEPYMEALTLPVVYDWELPAAESARTRDMDARTLTDCTLAFCHRIEEAGLEPIVYFNIRQSRYLMYLEELLDYDFWLAWYSDRMIYPYKVRMWQYTDSGSVPGIKGPVDMNIWFIYDETA